MEQISSFLNRYQKILESWASLLKIGRNGQGRKEETDKTQVTITLLDQVTQTLLEAIYTKPLLVTQTLLRKIAQSQKG